MRRTFLFIIAIVFLFSCTKDYINSPGSNSSGKGLIELSVKIPGQAERAPQGKTHSPEVPAAGTSAESTIRTLHIFAFNTTTGAKEVHEVLKIGADGSTATDEINGGANHPMWSGATQKLRVTITPGSKSLYIVSNWHTSENAEDGCPSLRAIDDSTTLHSIVRSHSATLGLPLVDATAAQHPVMFGLKSITLTGSEQNLDIELERVIARVDMYPAISTLLKNAGVEVKIEGIKFRNIAGASFLVPHNDGGTPALPVSPAAASSTLWAESSFGGTPMTDNITITNPATAEEDEKFGTFYVPEYIAADETKATEMVIKATYNGSIHYYAVKLHNGLSDLSKRYWVERNHWYRYNITITGRGSTNETMPDYDNVEIGLRNTDWEGGESTTPDVGFELPHGDITVMHFKGISRFILSTSKDYGVGSDVNWLSARRVKEGVGINERTYLEIMTRTNTTSSERTGHITVMLPNGLTQTLTVKQLTEAGSTWTNPTDGTTWYRANIGAARIEDPGFFYQWGINKSYSPYTPVAGVAPSLTEPLVSYGAVNWNEIPQVFPQSIPVTSWNTTASTDASWLLANDPCPNGYVVPDPAQSEALTANTNFPSSNPGWGTVNGVNGTWLSGANPPSVPADLTAPDLPLFFPEGGFRREDAGTAEMNQLRVYTSSLTGIAGVPRYMFGSAALLLVTNSHPSALAGMSLRCVKAGNVRYDGNGADGGSMSDRRFYAAGETVTIQSNTYTKAGYSFAGWEVLKPDGSVLHASIAAGGTFSYPASTEYVTVRAKWIQQMWNTWHTDGGVPSSYPTDTGDAGTTYTTQAAPSKTGYVFAGWKADGGDHNIYPAGQTHTYVRNINWTAVWSPYLTFHNGYSGNISQTAYALGTVVSLPGDPVRLGYVFSGWWTEPNSGGTQYTGMNLTMPATPLTLYASWEVSSVLRITTTDGGQTLTLTDDPSDPGLFFKFGSLVGISGTGSAYSISYYPQMSNPGYGSWGAIPYSTGSIGGINLATGTGDPCMIVGLSKAQIAAGERSGFRLPTNDEYAPFTTNYVWTSHSGVNGMRFNNLPAPFPGNWLPAGGFRNYDGGTLYWAGAQGWYWSSTPGDVNYSSSFRFDNRNSIRSGYFRTYGFSVRCVRQ